LATAAGLARTAGAGRDANMLRLVNPNRYMAALEERFASRAVARAKYQLKHSAKLQAKHEHLMQHKNAPLSMPAAYPPKPNMLSHWQDKIAAETGYENLAGYDSGMNLDHKCAYQPGQYGSVIANTNYQPPKPKPDMTKPGWWRRRS
jgi:hypothetical protein